MDKPAAERFTNSYKFDDFKVFVADNNLSKYEKIGFPDDYRKNKEEYIFKDIVQKLAFDTTKPGQTLLDIGPGCSDLTFMIQNLCEQNKYSILLCDSKEMLDQLPDKSSILKFSGEFPAQVPSLINNYQNNIDYIIAYSNLHCVFYDACIYKFMDAAVSLLKSGGKFLIGDIPNVSKRKRFFASATGIEFHKNFMNTNENPIVNNLQLEIGQIDDGIIMGIVQRYRGFGLDVYLLPQNPNLPLHNRREDILICKP